jgi:hypothetical protein
MSDGVDAFDGFVECSVLLDQSVICILVLDG